MAEVTGLTAEKMLEMADEEIIDAAVVAGELILTTRGGTDINVGSVIGPLGSADGLDWKASVRLATIAALPANTVGGSNTTLTANANGVIPNIDGVAPAVGNSILVKNEATGSKNGIYIVTSVGAAGSPWILTRRSDADVSAEIGPGTFVIVEEGSQADLGWLLTTNGPIVLGTTALTFAQFPPVVNNLAGTSNDILNVQQGTASTAFVDLATVGPSFSVVVGASGKLKITISALIGCDTVGGTGLMGFALSGANTLAPSDSKSNSFETAVANHAVRQSYTKLLTGLTPGATTITAKYRTTLGTSIFADREIIAEV